MATFPDPRPVPTALDDTLNGSANNDFLAGFDGNDSLSGGNGNDVFLEGWHLWETTTGDFEGGQSYDMGAGNDTYRGGAGQDVLWLPGATGGVELNFTAGTLGHSGQIDLFSEIEAFILTEADDRVTGRLAGSAVLTLGGNDTAIGLGDNAWLVGGRGTDLLDLRGEEGPVSIDIGNFWSWREAWIEGFEIVFGATEQTNTLVGGGKDETLRGGDLADSLSGEEGNDHLLGGRGDDRILGGRDADSLVGGAGHDVLDGGTGSNQIDAGDGNDTVLVAAFESRTNDLTGRDTVLAGDGNDTIQGAGGTALVYGGRGDDSVLGGRGSIAALLEEGNDIGWIARGSLSGGRGADSLSAGHLTDRGSVQLGGAVALFGDAGNDILFANGPDRVTMEGGTGDDLLEIGPGTGPFAATLSGGAGDDLMRVNSISGQAWLGGGDGLDRYEVLGGMSAVIEDLAQASTVVMGAFAGVRFTGSALADRVEIGLGATGGRARLTADLGEGDDGVLVGAEGNFSGRIEAGLGEDTVLGFAGGTLSGGAGNDVLGGANSWSFTAQGKILAGDGDDLVTFDGLIDIDAGRGNDTILTPGSAENWWWVSQTDADIFGGAGTDRAVLGTGRFAIYSADATPELTQSRDVVGVEFIEIGAGAIWLDDYLGLDLVLGAGKDKLTAHVGGHTYHLGSGADTSSGVGEQTIVHGESGNDWLDAGLRGTAYGGDGDDILDGTSGSALFGGEGADTVSAGPSDTVRDRVTLSGGAGNDWLTAYSVTRLVLNAGEGNDTLALGFMVEGSADLGAGNDQLDLTLAHTSILDLSLGLGADRILNDDSTTGLLVTVRDLDLAQDRLSLAGVTGLAGIDAITPSGNDVTLIEGGLTLVLVGVRADQLTDGLFL